ncbi:MAG: hypothetical protein WAN46_18290 [Gammaproteobacteria bacterium]
MNTLLNLITICLAFALVAISERFAAAGDDIYCARYARNAVAQNEENISKQCGLTGPRWHSDHNHHSAWCIKVSGNLAGAENQARLQALNRCAGWEISAHDRCEGYSTVAMHQNHLAQGCGLSGPRWHSDYGPHYRWCMKVHEFHAHWEEVQRQRGLESCKNISWPLPSKRYFKYLWAYPDNEETSYSGEYENNVQGITHDSSNWFISQTSDLWKIPHQHDLLHVNDSKQYPGVIHRRLSDIVSRMSPGYWHLGDISHFLRYVIAPIEGNCPNPPSNCPVPHAIVLLKADDLRYVSHAVLPKYKSLGWVAVNPEGYIYVSNDFTADLDAYQVNWSEIPKKQLRLRPAGVLRLLDENGAALQLGHVQGGVFSESGHLLYMLSGIHNEHEANEGVNVFDTKTRKRVGRLHYPFSPGGTSQDEPEGITVWDIARFAPGVGGQLHVGMVDNDSGWIWSDDDDFTLYHYGE